MLTMNVAMLWLQLPWKSLKNIVEYYYMWKTTDRYVQQKRVKAVEAESKLKQVYIPNFNKSGAGGQQQQQQGGITTTTVGTAPGGATIGTKSTLNGNCGPLNGTAGSNDVITVNGGKPCESCAETSSPHVSVSKFG